MQEENCKLVICAMAKASLAALYINNNNKKKPSEKKKKKKIR